MKLTTIIFFLTSAIVGSVLGLLGVHITNWEFWAVGGSSTLNYLLGNLNMYHTITGKK